MSDLLAIVDSTHTEEELVAEILRRHPDRVTVLVESEAPRPAETDTGAQPSAVDPLAHLAAAIESRTGAVVVGLANSREQLRGWRFDRIIGGRQPYPVFR